MFRLERALSLGDVSNFLLVLIALGGLAYTHSSFVLAKAQHETQIRDIETAFRSISETNEQVRAEATERMHSIAETIHQASRMSDLLSTSLSSTDENNNLRSHHLNVSSRLQTLMLRLLDGERGARFVQIAKVAGEYQEALGEMAALSFSMEQKWNGVLAELRRRKDLTAELWSGRIEYPGRLKEDIDWFRSQQNQWLDSLEEQQKPLKERLAKAERAAAEILNAYGNTASTGETGRQGPRD